ncbi:MAG: isoprenylcysteine carboxylmethyltransferase family protein [Proteobacteria bacterium]|nr:isoprenylcysteine carboxylmethyltransferase family protein [Pseudomonadota bacterium]
MPTLIVVYASSVYALFVAVSLYMAGFVANVVLLPKTIDSGTPGLPGPAAAVDLALVALFGVQHSVMARQRFKAWWTRLIPLPAERSTYVLMSTLAVVLLMVAWQPLPAYVWHVDWRPGATLLRMLFAAGWAVMLAATFLLDHLELFGLRQAWDHARGRSSPPSAFQTPGFYRWVRHPIYLGFLLAFWATPTMSQGHLLLAVAMTVYLFVGIAFEERDLVARFGDTYRAYRQRVPMVVPWRRP